MRKITQRTGIFRHFRPFSAHFPPQDAAIDSALGIGYFLQKTTNILFIWLKTQDVKFLRHICKFAVDLLY